MCDANKLLGFQQAYLVRDKLRLLPSYFSHRKSAFWKVS